MGTLIRTADAAGIDLIVLEKGTADPDQDKVLRASQGSVFHIPIITRDLSEFIEGSNRNVDGTALEHAIPYNQVNHQESFALLLGNEGERVNPDLLKQTTQNLNIPIYGQVESLKVAIAGSILMYHLKG